MTHKTIDISSNYLRMKHSGLHQMIQKEERAILIHSMGKVGSISVTRSFESMQLSNTRIYHTHHLNPDRLQKSININIKHGKLITRHLQDSKDFSRIYLDDLEKLKTTKVITLVREPIGRNISGFFQNIDFFLPDFIAQYESGELQIEEVANCFLEKYPHQTPLNWLDIEVKNIFGIDVFGGIFPKDSGYYIWHEPVNLLLVKLESITNSYRAAIKDFMGFNRIELPASNIGDNKKYNKAYKQFKESIVLPEQYINDMYSSRYSKHFYSERELSEFTRKWQGEKLSLGNQLQ